MPKRPVNTTTDASLAEAKRLEETILHNERASDIANGGRGDFIDASENTWVTVTRYRPDGRSYEEEIPTLATPDHEVARWTEFVGYKEAMRCEAGKRFFESLGAVEDRSAGEERVEGGGEGHGRDQVESTSTLSEHSVETPVKVTAAAAPEEDLEELDALMAEKEEAAAARARRAEVEAERAVQQAFEDDGEGHGGIGNLLRVGGEGSGDAEFNPADLPGAVISPDHFETS